MSSKKASSAKTDKTDDEVDKLFEGIGNDTAAPSKGSVRTASKAPPKPSSKTAPNKDKTQSELDILAELDNLAAERPAADRPTSRPHTPRLSSTTGPASTRSPKRAGAENTPPTSERTSEEKSTARKSGESSRSFHTSQTPATADSEGESENKQSWEVPATKQSDGSAPGGGWWGGIFATASAAVKTAEAAVKEIQQNEEAKRWAEQVKGNVGALRGLGGELRSRALPTFTNILHTLAPPISSHERLQIHITHDLHGYPSLDPLIYATFSRVMAQVEGGDLMVIQRGHESSPRRGSDTAGFTGSALGGTGWSDGPWWRQTTERRDIGAVKGLIEGSKLVRVSAEAYATDFYSSRGGVEEAAKRAAEVLSETNPVRSSDIFLAIQAISHTASADMFGGPATSEKREDAAVVEPPTEPESLLCFAIYLHDPVHSITFSALTQSLPQKWLDWLDASSSTAPPSSTEQGPNATSTDATSPQAPSGLPAEIADIINSGGVDPREWIAEWIEEALSLGVGVVAQRYVARRMGVGEGGIGRGKMREEVMESGGGEAARAI
ncbi:MAG: hypothetical protein M1817_002226 [Caeruleum heppii]|nr:MAG: hypothetical protein M1817_002226 [Caeruleum heppii]